MYQGQGEPIDTIKAAAYAGNLNAQSSLSSFYLNARHTVQIGLLTIMLLAVARVDYPYNQEGQINEILAQEAFNQFSNAYSPQASSFIKPFVLGKYNTTGYPCFSEIATPIQPPPIKFVIPQQDYSSNLTTFLIVPPPVIPPPNTTFPTIIPSNPPAINGFYVRDEGFISDGKTPNLDRFRVGLREKFVDTRDYNDLELRKYEKPESRYLYDIDRDIEVMKREKLARYRYDWNDRRILDPYAQPWPNSNHEASMIKNRLQRKVFLLRTQRRCRPKTFRKCLPVRSRCCETR